MADEYDDEQSIERDERSMRASGEFERYYRGRENSPWNLPSTRAISRREADTEHGRMQESARSAMQTRRKMRARKTR